MASNPAYVYDTTVTGPTGVPIRFDSDTNGTLANVTEADGDVIAQLTGTPGEPTVYYTDPRTGAIPRAFGNDATVYVRQADLSSGASVGAVLATITGSAYQPNAQANSSYYLTTAAASSTYLAKSTTGPTTLAAVPGYDSAVSDNPDKIRWFTSQEHVARALGWAIVTDSRYAGGAKGDGTTDDTAALIAAYTAAAASGGQVWHPSGTYLNTGNLPVGSNVMLTGAGLGSSILRLANGSNSDMLVSSGFDTLIGSGSNAGVYHVRIRDLEIDGNQAGQTALAATVTSGSNNLTLPQSTINVTSTANWPTPAGSTTVAAGSNGVNVNTLAGSGVLNVGSTSGFPASGVLTVVASGATAVVSYTGVTATSFTGCTVWTSTSSAGTLSTGATVKGAKPAYVTGVTGTQVIAYSGLTSTTLTGCAGGSGVNALQTGNYVYVNGRGVALYGSYIQMSDCYIHDCAGSNLHTAWGPGASDLTGSMESHFNRIKLLGGQSPNGGSVIGFQFDGPHDSYITECVAWRNRWAGFGFTSNAYLSRCHAWGFPQLYGYDFAAADCRAEGCYAEVSNSAGNGVRLLGVNTKWLDGWVNGVSGGQGMFITGSAKDYRVTGLFQSCTTYDVRYGGTDGGAGLIDILVQKPFGPVVLAHGNLNGPAVPSTVTFVDGTVIRTDASASGSNASSTITDSAIAQTDRGKAVFGTNIPANSYVGSVTTGTSFQLQAISGAAATPTGAVSGVTLVPVGSDLSDVAATTRIKAVALPPAGATATPVLSVDTSTQGFKKSGSLTPSASANTYGTAAAVTQSTGNVGVTMTDLTYTFSGLATETVTIRITAVFNDGTSSSITKTSTTNQTLRLGTNDWYSLTTAGKTVTTLAFDVQSSIASSTASVAYFFVGESV